MPVKILFLSANPLDTARLRLDEEVREIEQVINQTKFRDSFHLEKQFAVRISDFQGHLLRFEPNIVHISGHGSSIQELYFENRFGNACSVTPQNIGKIFMLLIGNIQCVILNACYSIGQAEAISQHIDFVIGMKSSISDAKAICFSKTFYQALGYGKCIRDAFDSANAQLEVEGLSADQLPILLSKGNGSNINGDLDLSNNHGLELQPQEFNASILWLETLHPVLREHLLDPLEMRYQVVLEMRIGTIGRKKHSYSEIARFFNVYPGRVRIYETQALSKITVLVRNDWQHWNKII